MLKKSDIDVFFQDVEALNFRFPVASLADSLGFSRSTVSRYMNSRQPSVKFIRKFYEVYPKPPQPGSTPVHGSAVRVPGDGASLLDLVVSLQELESAAASIRRRIYDLTVLVSDTAHASDPFPGEDEGTAGGENKSGKAN